MRLILLSAFVILSCSCSEPNAGHLPPQKMQQVLLDIHLAESYSMALHPDSNKRNIERNMDSLAVFYRSVFKRHHITSQDFLQSMDWYKHHPEDLDSIYAEIIPEMSKLEAAYN